MSALIRKHDFDSVFDSQKMFRLILEAASNPGRVVSIKEYADKMFGDHPAFLAAAMTLLDNEVSFSACENGPLSEEIASLTLAKRERPDAADFIFVCGPEDLKTVIENAKCGSLSDPHKSATVIIENAGEPETRLLLRGPGIDGRAEIRATKTVEEAVALRDAQNYEYPQGIDLLFLSEDGGLLAIPRRVSMEVA